MSKKRLFGLDKWSLGKELQDYKEHKQNKKGLGYLDEKVKTRSQKKYPCKKLKGEHNWILTDNIEHLWFLKEVYYIYKCSKCGKRNYVSKKHVASTDTNKKELEQETSEKEG